MELSVNKQNSILLIYVLISLDFPVFAFKMQG
jgi:hypothetical protein